MTAAVGSGAMASAPGVRRRTAEPGRAGRTRPAEAPGTLTCPGIVPVGRGAHASGRTDTEEAIPENESFPKCTPDRTYILYTCNILAYTYDRDICVRARGRRILVPDRGPHRPAGTASPGKGHLKKKYIYIYRPTYAPPNRVFYLFFFFSQKSIEVQSIRNSRNQPPTSRSHQSSKHECSSANKWTFFKINIAYGVFVFKTK